MCRWFNSAPGHQIRFLCNVENALVWARFPRSNLPASVGMQGGS